jgi:dUTP pyrophosphatase
MTSLTVRIERLPHGEGLPLPEYATEGAAGMDLVAACEEDITLAPGERYLIPTGFRIEVPSGLEAQIRGRSGLALKRGLGIPNAPGTIDSDYRGEVCVILINWSDEEQTIRRGDRIAQMVFSPVVRADLVESGRLSDTSRGGGGFGSSGV